MKHFGPKPSAFDLAYLGVDRIGRESGRGFYKQLCKVGIRFEQDQFTSMIKLSTARRGKHGSAPGATIIDSMSTLKIMGLDEEYSAAVAWVKNFNFKRGGRVSFFETTIRDLGGLLSAYGPGPPTPGAAAVLGFALRAS